MAFSALRNLTTALRSAGTNFFNSVLHNIIITHAVFSNHYALCVSLLGEELVLIIIVCIYLITSEVSCLLCIYPFKMLFSITACFYHLFIFFHFAYIKHTCNIKSFLFIKYLYVLKQIGHCPRLLFIF